MEGSGQIGESLGGLSGETWQQADHVGSGREEQRDVGMNKIRVGWCFSKNNPWFRFILDTLMKGTALCILIIKSASRDTAHSHPWIVNFSHPHTGPEPFHVDLKTQ